MTVRAVLFDLGSTLWHIPERPPTQTIREETVRRIFGLLRSWGVEPEGELRFLGRDIRLTVGAADKEAFENDRVSPHYPTVVADLVAKKGLDITEEQAATLWETWNLEGSFFGRRLYDDATETLDALRDRGYAIGLVTNRPFSGPAFHSELEELGLGDYLDALSISCDVGYMKPHPEIFRHALEALDIEPEEAVMVGDSLVADVAGGQALGMTAVWRRSNGIVEENTDGIEPDFVIDALRELPALPCFSANGA